MKRFCFDDDFLFAEFLKQPDTTKHNFSFESQQLSKSPIALANESPFCFGPRQCSEEDSGGGSEDSRQPRQPPPKIWSLARTATSDSPPATRKPPQEFEDYGPADRSNMFCDRTQLTYCKDDRMDGGRKEHLKHHPSFCEDGTKVDCKTLQVPFYVEETGRKMDVLKHHQMSAPFCKTNECAEDEIKLDCEAHQVPFYAEEGGRKLDVLKHHQMSKDHPLPNTFCKLNECAEGGLKVDCEMKQVPFYVDEGGRKFCPDKDVPTKLQVPFCEDPKDIEHAHPMSTVFCPETAHKQTGVYRDFGDRTSVAKDPCLFAKCEESACVGDRGSCMMQQPYATEFVTSGGIMADAYSRGRATTLSDAVYAPGGSRSNYFVADRFDQTMLVNKGADETH